LDKKGFVVVHNVIAPGRLPSSVSFNWHLNAQSEWEQGSGATSTTLKDTIPLRVIKDSIRNLTLEISESRTTQHRPCAADFMRRTRTDFHHVGEWNFVRSGVDKQSASIKYPGKMRCWHTGAVEGDADTCNPNPKTVLNFYLLVQKTSHVYKYNWRLVPLDRMGESPQLASLSSATIAPASERWKQEQPKISAYVPIVRQKPPMSICDPAVQGPLVAHSSCARGNLTLGPRQITHRALHARSVDVSPLYHGDVLVIRSDVLRRDSDIDAHAVLAGFRLALSVSAATPPPGQICPDTGPAYFAKRAFRDYPWLRASLKHNQGL